MKITQAQVTAALCRKSLSFFMKTFWPIVAPNEKLHWNWHIDILCDSTQEVYERIFKNEPKAYDLVTNVPPGSSKSTVKSVMAPAWAWTRMPNFAFLGASFAHPVALDLARKNRDVVQSELYQTLFPGITLRDDQNAKTHFRNTQGGLRYAVGSRGSITGFHFLLIAVDDPLDPTQAASDAELYTTNEWIRNTLFQRKKDSQVSVIDLVMQRLHQNDPSAWMIENPNVRHICLPATLEFAVKPPELAEKYIDGLLDPVRLPQKVLDEKRLPNNLGEYGFAGQYGEDPVPAGGGSFKTHLLRYGTPPGKYRRIVRYWDNAASKMKRAAFTAGVKMAEDTQGGIWILDVKRGHWDSAERERVKLRTAKEDGVAVIIGQEQEPGSSGMDSVLTTARGLKGYNLRILKARGTKEVRADAFSSQVNSGNVFMPDRFRVGNQWTGWAKEFIDELKFWPFSTFLDQGDAASGAYSIICRGRVYVGPVPKKSLTKTA